MSMHVRCICLYAHVCMRRPICAQDKDRGFFLENRGPEVPKSISWD